MKIVNNEEEIQNRANWLYHSNGGNLSKLDCARQAVEDLTNNNFVRDLIHLTGASLQDYIYSVAENIKEDKQWN